MAPKEAKLEVDGHLSNAGVLNDKRKSRIGLFRTKKFVDCDCDSVNLKGYVKLLDCDGNTVS